MTGNGRKDAIVIGAGGLAAAAYLARAGLSVTVLEAEGGIGGPGAAIAEGARAPTNPICALDPRVVKDLKLVKHGLRFALRDMPLVGLRPDGKHLVLGRDVHQAARSIAAHSPSDALAFPTYRRDLFALARAMRAVWWEEDEMPGGDLLARLKVEGSAAFLNGWFETDALKAALAFDADGFSPLEAGSGLALLWHAAQEMRGLQGALAVPLGSTLADALLAAAQTGGVELRTKARVARILVAGGAATGVELDSGEQLLADTVVSSLSRRATLLDLTPTASAGFAATHALAAKREAAGEAALTFVLNAKPDFVGQPVPLHGRFVFAERLESHAIAQAAARAGRLSDELLVEAWLATEGEPGLAPPGQHILCAIVRFVPLEGRESLGPRLREKVVSLLDRHAPGLKASIVAERIAAPDTSGDPVSAERLSAPFSARIRTPIEGLFLCGRGAEPMPSVSYRACRLAVAAILARRKPK
jgi:phytoene dehydrogenase-like protein